MRSLSFLLSRRWILFLVAVLLLAWLAWLLGEWQFHRLEDRKERNDIVERNTEAEPAPVEDLLTVGTVPPTSEQWRRVRATGTYAPEDTVIVRYRTRDGAAGVNVVVPLETDNGPVLFVDRGWMATENRGATAEEVPPPPSGQVTVTGWIRRDATGDSARVTDHSTRSISSKEMAEALDLEAYGGFVELESEDPPPDDALEPVALPELDNGPHFFYGLQWWFFGLLAIIGFFWMAWDEWRKEQEPEESEGADHPAVDREHGTADEG